MVRITKVYTKSGDRGTTHLVDGSSVPKDALRVASYGDIDELNAKLGEVLELSTGSERVTGMLRFLQNQLFDLGAELATPAGFTYPNQVVVTDAEVTRLEQWIDELNDILPALQSFVLPAGSPRNALLHSARTICRRAERAIVTHHHQYPLPDPVLRYVNRLSDLLFVMARYEILSSGGSEVLWQAGMKP